MKPLTNEYGTIHSNLSVTLPDGRIISRERMQEHADNSRGANRIHKPFILLMWIDCKNGYRSNWTTD